MATSYLLLLVLIFMYMYVMYIFVHTRTKLRHKGSVLSARYRLDSECQHIIKYRNEAQSMLETVRKAWCNAGTMHGEAS